MSPNTSSLFWVRAHCGPERATLLSTAGEANDEAAGSSQPLLTLLESLKLQRKTEDVGVASVFFSNFSDVVVNRGAAASSFA